MEAALVEVVKELGGEDKYIELSTLKANVKLRSFFRRVLFKPPWEDDTFAMYFLSRHAAWDFDEKTRGVKLLSEVSKQIQQVVHNKRRTQAFPEALYTAVLKAGTHQETVGVVANAQSTDLGAMPIDSIECLLDSVGQPPNPAEVAANPALQPMHLVAQQKVLAAVRGALEKKGSGLGQVMEFYQKVIQFGGETPLDPRVQAQKIATLKELCEHAAGLISEKGLGNVGPKVLALLCATAPFHIVALSIAHLGDKGEGDDVKACAAMLGKIPAHVLEGLSESILLQLAVAATKSASVAEATLAMVAKACASTLPAWSTDDVAKLLLALSKAKSGAEGAEVAEVYGRAAEALSGKLSDMSVTQLIKVALVLGRVPSCKEFLQALAAEAVNRLADMPAAQLILLTQGLLPLGSGDAAMAKILEAWASGLSGSKLQLPADQLAKLAAIVAPAAPALAEFWTALGAKLIADQKGLTDAGWASFEAAFPEGGGPDFPEKESLTSVARKRKENSGKRSRSRDRDRDDKKKDRSRSRGRDDRRRSRSRDRRRSRDHDRRRSRSRSRRRR